MWVTAFELENTDFLVGLIKEEFYIPEYKVVDGKVLIYSEHKRDAEKEKAYYESYLINFEFILQKNKDIKIMDKIFKI